MKNHSLRAMSFVVLALLLCTQADLLAKTAIVRHKLPRVVAGPPPVITTFAPILGTSGTSVTLTGVNFSATASNNIVYFGAVQAAIISATTTQLVVTVPVGAIYAPITETVNGLTAYAPRAFLPTFPGNGSNLTLTNFSTRLDLQGAPGSFCTAVADMDGDGKPDLVVATAGDSVVSIFRNISTNGPLSTASFAQRIDLPTPPGAVNPYFLVVADVDGDGKLDIVVTDYTTGQVSIYRNTSTPGNLTAASFSNRVDLTVGSQPTGLTMQDLDGDGKPDLIVANSGDSTLSILRNISVPGILATNSFAAQIIMPSGPGCHFVVAGDLDGDGRVDLVTANFFTNTISVFRNLSTSAFLAFAPKVDLAAPGQPQELTLGDVDGDGKTDIILASYQAGQSVSVFRNVSTTGNLTVHSFAPHVDFPLNGWGHNAALGDLNGDGKPDLAVVSEINSQLSVFQNLSTPGSFTNSSLGSRLDFGTGTNPWNVTIGDLDGDGRPEIIFANQTDGTISIYQNQTAFGSAPFITAQPTNQTVTVGGNTSFSVGVTGTAPLLYQWKLSNEYIFGATNSTLVLTNVQLSQAGNYSVSITNQFGGTNSAVAVLTVANACTAAGDGIVSWWPAEGSANDVIGNGNGTLVGNVSYGPGQVGLAFNFNGTNGYVQVSGVTNLSARTIEGWVYANSNTGLGLPIIVSGQGSQIDYFGITGTSGGCNLGQNHLYIDHFGSSCYDGGVTVTPNQWTHVAMVYNGSQVQFFVNGVAGPITAAPLYSYDPNTATIGGNLQGGTTTKNFFNGLIDELSVYNRALTTNEIQAIYNSGSTGKCPLPPTITLQPVNQNSFVGQTVTFSAGAAGTLPLSYQWFFNASNAVAGATNSNLILTNVQFAQAGNYSVQVTNLFGATNSASAALAVLAAPPCTPAPANLVSWWPAEASANDVIGNANGTWVGNASYGPGEAGLAFNFTGGNGYVQVGGSTNLSGARTIEGWVYASPNTGLGLPIIVSGQGSQADYFGITGTSGGCNLGQNHLYIDHFGSSCYDGGVTVTPNQWNHVAMVYNGSQVQFFVNGVAGPITTGTLYNYNLNTATIGGNLQGGTTTKAFFNGLIDELSVYNRALTTNEIQAIYNAGSADKCALGIPLIITTQPTNQTATVGGSANFNVSATGSGLLKYQWSFNSNSIAGATNATLTLTNVQTTNAGIYAVQVTDAYHSVLSSNALLTVTTPTCDPSPSGLISWWAGEANANDSIGTNNGTLVGGTTFTNGEVGQAFFFNGSDNVTIPDSASLDSFTTNITIEFWMQSARTGNNPDWAWAVTKGNTSWRVMGTTFGNTMSFDTEGINAQHLPGTRNVNDGQWHHIAAVYDGITKYLYVDGALDASQPASGSLTQNTEPLELGENSQAGGAFQGELDEVSIYKRALSAGEVQQIYTAGALGKCGTPPIIVSQPTNQTVIVGKNASLSVSVTGGLPLVYQWTLSNTNIPGATNATLILNNVQFSQAGNYAVSITNQFGGTNSAIAMLTVNPVPPCDPSPSGLISWWAGEANANDSIGTNNGTLVGGTTFTNGEVGQAFFFNGSDNVTIPDSASLDSFTTNITIEFWMQSARTGNNPNWAWAVTKGNTSWRVMGTTFGNTMSFDTEGINAQHLPGTRNVNDGQWHHIAAVYDGITKYLYVDGALDASQPASGSLTQNTEPLELGENSQAGSAFQGALDEVSIYKRALSAGEVQQIYAAGISGKCTPVTPPLIVSHFSWSNIVSPQFVNTPFAVAIQARDVSNALVTNFTGTVILSSTNKVPVNPAVSANFVGGMWTGNVTITQAVTHLVLRANDGSGDVGTANPVNVVTPPMLGAKISGNTMQMSWPVTSPAFVLEYSCSLRPCQWEPVLPGPTQIGGQYVQSLPLTQTNCFYHLRYLGQ